ncbi:hypothetical protein RJT34_25009 [Clitoria ternatea]|uniref:CCHC-type domain-containing protein n=1 Tax=Clitoria ternatea TaxID=43366 RepID=A0AAN9FXB4_CLITE
MVSARQRLARKRYRAEHPELHPKPQPTPPKDPLKKKKNKNNLFKRKKDGSDAPHSKTTFRKHPLRIPGMRPGESCYICKAKDHIAKLCPQKAEWEKNKICLRCRKRGHRALNCPEVHDGASDGKCCYNCGETGHSLSNCPQPLQEGGTKFAECFICSERGHLSKNCPQNTRGIYPKGGCCKICGGVTHLAKDCPDKGKKGPIAAKGPAVGSLGTDLAPRGKVTKFVSGDDYEDDFMTDDIHRGDKNNSAIKPKKVHKVVNFN